MKLYTNLTIYKRKILTNIIILIFSVFFLNHNIFSYADSNSYTKARAVENIDIISQSFISSNISVNNKPYNLASKNQITIKFDEKSLSITAGCNTIFGNYNIYKGILISSENFTSKKACSKALMKDDIFLNKLLNSKPTLSIQFLKNTQNTSKHSILLSINSKITPNNKPGKTVIKFYLNERYGYADTPLGDQESAKLIKKICNQLLLDRATEQEAQIIAEENALIFRVFSRDGEDFPVTADYRINRVNVKILNNQVIDCLNG
jgi:heat shock protein HslJ